MKPTLYALLLGSAFLTTLTASAGSKHGSHATPASAYNHALPAHSPAPSGGDRLNRAGRLVTGPKGAPEVTPLFGVKPGAHLFGGKGEKRGQLASSAVKINYGQQKVMVGKDHQRHVYNYAFATQLKGGQSASGWVRRSALVDRPVMPTLNARRAPGPTTTYKLKNTAQTAPLLSKYGNLKVNRKFGGSNRAATDYIGRPGGYTNLLYNLPGTGKGGVSTDTFKGGTTFHRSRSVKSYDVALYHPNGTRRAGHEKFVYGSVDTPTGKRSGWIAYDALQHVSPPSPHAQRHVVK